MKRIIISLLYVLMGFAILFGIIYIFFLIYLLVFVALPDLIVN